MARTFDARPPTLLCEDEALLLKEHSRMYFVGMAFLPWRTQLRSGALPLNAHVRPLVTALCGPRRTEMQALLWPHILHGHNSLLIDNPLYSPQAPPEYSNTMDSGYIIPMLLRIAESCGKRHSNHLLSEGPLAVIITTNLEESMAVVQSIRKVEQQLNRPFRVVNVFEQKNEPDFQKKSLQASESCDVLVATMNVVSDLFLTQGRLGSPPINVMKVELVVLRNVDVMIQMSPPIASCSNSTKDRASVESIMIKFGYNSSMNYVFAASSPSQAVRALVGRLENPFFTVITNMLDAVLYEKLPIMVMEANRKLPFAMAAQATFNDRPVGERIVLFVSSDRQAIDLKKMIALNSQFGRNKSKTQYDFQTISEGAPIYEVTSQIRDWWANDSIKDKVKLLVIPDSIGTDFGISDADLAIHLSAPTTIQQFMKRFCCIKSSFQMWERAYVSLAKGSKATVLPKVACRIMVDATWRPILPLLVHIASASPEYSVIPASVINAAQAALQAADFLRMPPCLQQLYIGECMNTESCAARHYQGPKVALTSALSQCKSFQFTILRFLNPAHFLVRLVKYQTMDSQTVQVDRSQKHLDELLANILDELPQPFGELPPTGEVCGMVSRDGNRLLRVQILKEINEDYVHICYVDEGVGLAFAPSDVRHPRFPARVKSTTTFYPLPEEVRHFEKTWTNLVLSGIRPSNLELGWRQTFCGDVYAHMKTFIAEKSVMECQPVFITEDVVFVENFRCWKILNGHRACQLEMKNVLNRYAPYVPNLQHLEKLKKSFVARSAQRGQSATTLLPLYPSSTGKPNIGEGDASACTAQAVGGCGDDKPQKGDTGSPLNEALEEKAFTVPEDLHLAQLKLS
ncbi:hypothetical protein BV898_10469 [Hypsibius exemplaris]|uniref:RNA helicase n=1 Tax=Hypsibius exemplaris TaxID=2072580 RepID=A0A1W0WJR2_HYPEX|nr:hypothetical protein BV898_10469 [Hypsibius exemplaris]